MKRWLAPLLAVALLSVTACGSEEVDDAGNETTLVVYAAASLRAPFLEIGDLFMAANDGIEVEFHFAGSSDLVAQIANGAQADVVATADEATMEKVTDEELADSQPRPFASNTLQVVTPADNPGDVQGLRALAETDLDVVVCAPEVPCGAAAERLAERAGITLSPDSEEQSVAGVLGKVTAGEADAGLVYVTDALAAGDDVLAIDVPGADSVATTYPIAPLTTSFEPELAQAFVDLVLAAEGQQVLADAGFGQP